MAKIMIVFLFTFLVSCSANNELNQQESSLLKQELKGIITSFNQGNATLTIEKIHPMIFKVISKDNYLLSINQGVENAHLAKVQHLIINKPSELYDLGKEEICFIPIQMKGVVNDPSNSLNGRTFIDESFRVAIRNKMDKQWLFLELGTLEEQNKIFQYLFPNLPKNIKLPKNEFKVL